MVNSPIVLLKNGEEIHNRSLLGNHFGDAKGRSVLFDNLPKVRKLKKHKFVYWFDKSAREVFMLKQPQSRGRAGKIPTHALQS